MQNILESFFAGIVVGLVLLILLSECSAVLKVTHEKPAEMRQIR